MVYAKSISWGVTLLSSFLHSLYLPSACCGPGPVPGDGDIRMNKIRSLPQGEGSSKGEALTGKYINSQRGKCSRTAMPRR